MQLTRLSGIPDYVHEFIKVKLYAIVLTGSTV